MNAKYQMHLRLRELALPPDNPPIEISEATLCRYISSLFFKLFKNAICHILCNINDCFVCNNSN